MLTQVYAGNLFLLPKSETEAAVVTTNGVLKRDGSLVMGAGIAKYCRDRYHGIDVRLGEHVKFYGNIPAWAGTYQDINRKRARLDPSVNVISCPTKRHFRDGSDIELIRQSCEIMMQLATSYHLTRIYMPALGCALGGLSWENTVKPVCEEILDDRFVAAISPDVL